MRNFEGKKTDRKEMIKTYKYGLKDLDSSRLNFNLNYNYVMKGYTCGLQIFNKDVDTDSYIINTTKFDLLCGFKMINPRNLMRLELVYGEIEDPVIIYRHEFSEDTLKNLNFYGSDQNVVIDLRGEPGIINVLPLFLMDVKTMRMNIDGNVDKIFGKVMAIGIEPRYLLQYHSSTVRASILGSEICFSDGKIL